MSIGINVLDAGTSQANLDFDCAARAGWDAVYVKLGGDNSGRYVSPYYRAEVNAARSAGMRVGHYWVPDNDMDPVGAADYFVDNLQGWSGSDFVVLDNESLDGSQRYDDYRAAAWINRVYSRLGISGKQVKHYSGLSDARSTNWPNVLGTGTQFIIAAYSYSPGDIPDIPTVPAGRIDGHQYSSSGEVCGVVTDRNVFRENAFDYSSSGGGSGGGSGGSGGGSGGGGGSTGDGEEEEVNYIKITGKSGARRGGVYAVFALGGGKYAATFIGSGGPNNLNAVSDDGQIAELQKRISGLA